MTDIIKSILYFSFFRGYYKLSRPFIFMDSRIQTKHFNNKKTINNPALYVSTSMIGFLENLFILILIFWRFWSNLSTTFSLWSN